MKLTPAKKRTKNDKVSQWCFNATLTSERNVFVAEAVDSRTRSRSRKALVSGRQRRKMINRTGGQAPNQNKGRQPWLVVSTSALAKTVASRYPMMYPTCRIPDIRPRAAGGQSSSAVATAFPYIPPIAIPNKERQARNCL